MVIMVRGVGGLKCGIISSKEGYNVCILEQSPIYGGCLQSFSRKGVKIDTGIHYIGSMDEGQIMRQYLKYFGVFDQLSVVKLDQDFDIINMNGTGEFNLNQGYDNFRSYLTEMFPTERNGIFRYCRKLNEIGSSISVDIHKKGLLSSGINDNLNLSASEFINECVSDKILQNLLAGTNLLYAGVRESSNLYHHAMINHSNIEGSYRIVGSTQTLADLLVKQIQNYGGTVLNNSCVANIHTEGMKVEYVELTNSERIYGKHFISNIHPRKTLDMIATTPVIKKAYRTRFNLLPNTYGLFSVYLLMKPGSMPYQNKNFYYFDSDDVWDTTIQKPDYKVK